LSAVIKVVGLALASAATLAACGAQTSSVPANLPTNAAVTTVPNYKAPTGEPTLPGLATASPKPGEIARVDGPFSDRYVYRGLSFDGHTLSGIVFVTTDVSTLLDLQVLAGFYDADGRLIGHGRFSYQNDEMSPDAPERNEPQPFRIKVPANLVGRAVSASVGVPVLVNE
jgi:hypothetical protein